MAEVQVALSQTVTPSLMISRMISGGRHSEASCGSGADASDPWLLGTIAVGESESLVACISCLNQLQPYQDLGLLVMG